MAIERKRIGGVEHVPTLKFLYILAPASIAFRITHLYSGSHPRWWKLPNKTGCFSSSSQKEEEVSMPGVKKKAPKKAAKSKSKLKSAMKKKAAPKKTKKK